MLSDIHKANSMVNSEPAIVISLRGQVLGTEPNC